MSAQFCIAAAFSDKHIPNRIIIAARSRIAEADESIQVQMLLDFSPGFLRCSGPDDKSTVEDF